MYPLLLRRNQRYKVEAWTECAELAICVNYAKINNSMLRMRGHVSAGFFCCDVLFLQGKRNGFRARA